MSQTLLKDRSILFIGGEHEDSYDQDFAIYNDVIVRRWDGSIEIYGYPVDDFAPTDFHTATLVGEKVYIIGSVGREEDRILGTTPIYELELETMMIRQLAVRGEEPGWIHKHEAIYWAAEDSILIWGGTIMWDDKWLENQQMWAFSLRTQLWRRLDSVHLKGGPRKYAY